MSNYMSPDHPTFHKHHDQECDDPQCHRQIASERLGQTGTAMSVLERGRVTVDPPDAISRTTDEQEVARNASDDGWRSDLSGVSENTRAKYREIEAIRSSGHVRRYHVVPIVGQQTVAEHSAQALSLLLLLHPDPQPDLIRAMLWHDVGERVVGDAPAPGRRRFSYYGHIYDETETTVNEAEHPTAARSIANLSTSDQIWLRSIDVLEAIMFCSDQMMLGNTHAKVMRDRCLVWIGANRDTPTQIVEFLSWYLNQPGGPRSFA